MDDATELTIATPLRILEFMTLKDPRRNIERDNPSQEEWMKAASFRPCMSRDVDWIASKSSRVSAWALKNTHE